MRLKACFQISFSPLLKHRQTWKELFHITFPPMFSNVHLTAIICRKIAVLTSMFYELRCLKFTKKILLFTIAVSYTQLDFRTDNISPQHTLKTFKNLAQASQNPYAQHSKLAFLRGKQSFFFSQI